jgi:hypothetical protein
MLPHGAPTSGRVLTMDLPTRMLVLRRKHVNCGAEAVR